MSDDFDDVLRGRLQQPGSPASPDANRVYSQLRPRMRRARIRRSVAIGTASLSFLGVAGVGLAAVTSTASSKPADVAFLVEGERLPVPAPQTSSTAPAEAADTNVDPLQHEVQKVGASPSLPEPTTTTVEGHDPATTNPDPSTTVSVGATQPPTSPATMPASTTPAVTPPPPTTPSTVTTTTTTTTTTTAPESSGQRTVASNCGSITVDYSGGSISLTGTQPAAGFAVDVKNSGPEQVEVGFANGDAECEIKAWVESGVLRTDVDNHEDEDG